MRGNETKLVLLFLVLFCFSVSAGIVNYSFEVQSSSYNTDALGWTEFTTNALFQDYNAETEICSNQSTMSTGLPDTFTREYSEDARHGSYLYNTYSSGVSKVSFTRNNYYIGTLGLDTNICFWIKGWVNGRTGFRLGFWNNINNHYCRVADIGGVDANWNYGCAEFKTGTYDGYLTLEKEWLTTSAVELLWDGFDSSNLEINILKPTPTQFIEQREPLTVEFEIKDNDQNFLDLKEVLYRMDALDTWTTVPVNGFGLHSFDTNALNETGEHILTIIALVNGNWIHGSTKYLVSPKEIDLKVNFIKAIQVIEDVDLVEGKDTAVIVGINNTNDQNQALWIKTKLTFNGQEYEEDDYFWRDRNIVFYPESYDVEGTYTIIAEIDPFNIYKEINEATNNIKTQDINVVKTETIEFTFIPVNLDNQGRYTYNREWSFFGFEFGNYYISNKRQFEEDILYGLEFLEAVYPQKGLNYKIDNEVFCLNNDCSDRNYHYGNVTQIFLGLALREGLVLDPNVEDPITKRIIGVLPQGGFGDMNSAWTGTLGLRNGDINAVVAYEWQARTGLAHEVGHTYNLCEEYNNLFDRPSCPNHAPPDCNISCPAGKLNCCAGAISDYGYWVKEPKEIRSYDLNIRNPLNVFNFMGDGKYDPNKEPPEYRRWTNKLSYETIFSILKLTGAKSGDSNVLVVLVTGLIDKSFDVNINKLYQTYGAPTLPNDGNCLVRTKDINGTTLDDINFSTSFIMDSGPIEDTEYSPIILKVPFSDVNSIEIICNGEVKYEKLVSSNYPVISITSPSGGEEWSGENLIEWEANDLDGDELEFVLQYSDDNGLSWSPLGMYVTDENFTFDVGMVDGNTQYKIKVIATDGILTGEDVSETFSILNPDITIVPAEWNLETINELQNVSQDFNIVNSGNADLNVFDVNYSDDLNVTNLNLPILLESGEGHVFSVELEVLDMNLGEFNEDINLGSNDPNQIVERIEIYGEIEQAKPDFRVTEDNITFNPVYLEEDQNVVVSALVENLGDLNAENVNVKFYLMSANQYLADSNTVALYHFNKGIGTTIKDWGGNENEGDINGATFNGDAKFGDYSLRFNGDKSGNVVTVPDSDSLDIAGEMTLEFWVKPDGSQEGGAGIVCKGYGGAESYCLDVSGNKFRFIIRTSSTAYTVSSASSLVSGEWQHIAATLSGTKIRIYVNGVYENIANSAPAPQLNDHELSIGARRGSGSSGYDLEFKGLIDEVRISDIGRTDFNSNKIFVDDKNISFIDANSTELVSIDWNNVKEEEYKVYVSIDDENIFDERDERNNEDFNSVTVYSEPLLSVDFEYQILNDLGETFDLNAIITNTGAKLLDANANLILPNELTTTDPLTKTIGNLNSHTSIKIEWTDINSSQAGLYEIIVNVKGSNADENFSAFTSIRRIELSDLNVMQSIYPDDINIADFNIINFNPNISYAGYYYTTDINGPQNYSEDKNVGLLRALETKPKTAQINAWKETGNYTITISLYDYDDQLIDQKQDSFKVIPYMPSMLTYYSTDGLTFNPEFNSYADYFSSASDGNNQVMVVYDFNGDMNYSIRNPIAQEWSSPQTIASGSNPYLVADGNDFHLVYVDSNIYYRKYSGGAWNSAELVSEMNSVDPVITLNGSSLYVLFSSNDLSENFNVYLSGFNGSWNKEMEITHCLDANCSNPIVLDDGLVNEKLSYAYRKFKGEEYSTLDSNLMFSLFDVDYFYWGNIE